MRHFHPHRPPRFTEALLSWLVADEWQTPLGDFEEYYHRLAAEEGHQAARWWYRRQVWQLVPNRLYEKAYWTLDMLKNYFVLAYRNLLKNKVPAAINLFGLSVAVACSVVVYLFIFAHLTFDHFHEHAAEIYLVEHQVAWNGEVQTWGMAPAPLAAALEAEFPQVERAVRMQRHGAQVQHTGERFGGYVSFVDPDFLELFTFPLERGDPAALADPNAVILSAQAAERFFGDAQPLDEELQFTFENGQRASFVVRGVAEPFPQNAGLRFDYLVPFEQQRVLGLGDYDDWATFVDGLFIQVPDPAQLRDMEAQMDPYLARQNAANEEWAISGFVFDNLRHPMPRAAWVRRRPAHTEDPMMVYLFALIPVFMLALACFNYVNISLGSAARRLKEIGLRKMVGGRRSQLVFQFLAENLLLCFLSLLAGVVLAQAVLIPAFNGVFVVQLALSFTESLHLWGFLGALLAFVGLASGLYPAWYLTSFQPVDIFRGKRRLADKKLFTHVFLTGQFVLAFITVIVSVYLTLNGRYIVEQDWGYRADQTLVVPVPDGDSYTRLHDALAASPDVLTLAGAQRHVGHGIDRAEVHLAGQMETVGRFTIGPGYLEAMGLPLVAGRSFDAARGTDLADAILVNQAFLEAHGWSEGVGETLRMDGETHTVIGVVGDFLFHPLISVRPLVFEMVPPAEYAYLVARVAAGQEAAAVATVEAAWEQVLPEDTFTSFFQDSVFDTHYQSYQNVTGGLRYLSLLALLIACMGLYGLAAQNVARRLKEVSIRKVLGATVWQLTVRVNRGFLMMLGIAALLATALTYAGLWLLLTQVGAEAGVNLMPVGPAMYGITYLIVSLTALLSVATQVGKLIRANPAEVLRNA